MKRVPTTLERLRMAEGRVGWYVYMRDHPERAAFYKSGQWRRARARHLAAHRNCVVCGEPAKFVDHIVNRAEGGGDLDPDNLQSLCRRCHGRKTQAESHWGRKRAAERRKR